METTVSPVVAKEQASKALLLSRKLLESKRIMQQEMQDDLENPMSSVRKALDNLRQIKKANGRTFSNL